MVIVMGITFREAYDELKNLYRVEDVEEINLGGGSFNYCHLVPVSTQFMEMMTKLINLRKPRYLSKNTDGQYVCSRCHSVISKYYDGIYCCHCGQRIKFGREDYDND